MFRRLLPETTDFFSFFEEHIEVTTTICRELIAMTENGTDFGASAARVKDLERKADDVTRRCMKALQRTFITPFDRMAIKSLIGSLDDIPDAIDEAVSRLSLFDIHELRPEVRRFAEVLLKASEELAEALKLLRSLKNEVAINHQCVQVLRLENEGDVVLRQALISLFRETQDPILIIKWKEIFEYLEEATDCTEDVANQISGIVIEAS